MTVTFTPTWQDHLKTLTCQLKGDNDKCNKRSFVLLVQGFPKEVQVRFNHTENNEVKENETLTVTCEVKHSHPNVIFYIFMRNEEDLQNGSSSEFVISKVSENDAGEYSCKACNKIGSTMSPKLKLDVQYPPKEMEINSIEDKDNLKEGQSVTFNCNFQRSNPTVTKYVWYKNGIAVSNENMEKLTIKNISYTSDKGKIECEAHNKIGGTRSKQLTLNVMYSPKETNASVNNPIIKENTRVTIKCVTKANPRASYHWFKDGRPWKKAEASEYIFNKIMISDSGNYFCQASNQEGTQNSSVIQLDVIYAPKDVQLKMNPSSMVKQGDLVLLNCTIGRSNPTVSSVTWYRNSVEIKRGTTRSLEFKEIHHNQSGTYYCDATNSVGKKQSNTIEMNILYGPTETYIEANVKTNQVKVGRNIVLECRTSSNPASHFTWHKNDSGGWKQQEPVGYQLTFQQITISNGGYFFCTAENDINSANSSIFHLDVLYPPTTPKMTFENNAREGFQAFIECQVESNPPAQLSISHIDKKSRDVKMMQDTNALKMCFMNLTSKDAGQYLCTADNTEGKSETKGDFIVKYSPKDVSLTILTSRVIENKPVKLVCDSVAYPPSSRYSWFKEQGDSQHKVGDNKELFFSSVSIQDSGQYFCTADNSMGQGHSKTSYLDVLYQPKKVRVLHNIGRSGVKQGDTIVLSCSCVSNPPANVYMWHKITENDMNSIVDNEQNITIHDFSVQHEGYYYCTAHNIVASESSQQISLFLFNWGALKIIASALMMLLFVSVLVIVIFMYRRKKRKSDQSESRNNSQWSKFPFCLGYTNAMSENLMMRRVSNQQHSQEHLTGGLHNPAGFENSVQQTPDCPQRPKPSPQKRIGNEPDVVYSTVVNSGCDEQARELNENLHSNVKKKPTYDNDTLNYVSLPFHREHKEKEELPGKKEDNNHNSLGSPSNIYSKLQKPLKDKQKDKSDYENVKMPLQACQEKPTEHDGAARASEDLHYSTVTSYRTKKQNLEWESESSSEDESKKTVYSAVRL
ncbi:B-cell receptor CD22 [Polypterus senegalus]|uniref:B-cell receptor CD22 n=1 Tax=Polypterus senegalus TaxID=55291 RepID=UPI0019649B56|nr:B-cell receptor CD22 [Polypterus senegalus]